MALAQKQTCRATKQKTQEKSPPGYSHLISNKEHTLKKDNLFNMVLGKLNIQIYKIETRPYSKVSHPIQKWIKYLNIRGKTLKLLGENRGNTGKYRHRQLLSE
jgi:hypothetical protein